MHPYLEHFPEASGTPQRIVLDQFPFQIGRSERANFVLFARQVSKEHAEIRHDGQEAYSIHDLASTNGTFVNGKRVATAPLNNGDVVHIATTEFRFGCRANGPVESIMMHSTDCNLDLVPLSVLLSGKHLREMVKQQLVSAVFQPIVALDSLTIFGYECLGRGTHAELTKSPRELFELAEKCQLAPELSRSFRHAGVQEASRFEGRPRLFFNLHPSEMRSERLLNSLREATAVLGGDRRVVVEVHEDAVADTAALCRLRETLNELGIGLAYDDFGAGQARLAELAEAPPDFVKLDIKLVRDIEKSKPRQEVIQALAQLCNDLGVQLIAEGIETAAEAAVCGRMGCQLGQGYLLGRPCPVSGLALRRPSDTRRVQVHEISRILRRPGQLG